MDLKLPEWASVPTTGFPGAIEPPAGKKQTGYDNGEEPAAGHVNWIFQAIADAQKEVANAITGLGGTLDAANLSQLLAAHQRQALKAALGGIRLADDLGAGTLTSIARNRAGSVIAVGSAGLIVSGTGYSSFATETGVVGYGGDFNDIVYDAVHDVFIVCGTLSAVHTSTGNGTWTQRLGGGGTVHRAAATDGAGHVVVVGNAEQIWSSSNPASSWANRTSPFAGTPDIVGVAFGAGAFVCVTDAGEAAYSLNSGVTWTQVTPTLAGAGAPSGGGGPKVQYHSSVGFIYHYAANVYQSWDGITWTRIHSGATSSTGTPGLLVTPYCWSVSKSSGGNGTRFDGRYSVTALNADADFRADYVVADGLTALKFIDGQLMALAGSKIFMGGVV